MWWLVWEKQKDFVLVYASTHVTFRLNLAFFKSEMVCLLMALVTQRQYVDIKIIRNCDNFTIFIHRFWLTNQGKLLKELKAPCITFVRSYFSWPSNKAVAIIVKLLLYLFYRNIVFNNPSLTRAFRKYPIAIQLK